MLKNPTPLNPALHRHLTLSETSDYGFASDMMFTPIVFKEMADSAREYPVLFRNDIDLPVVLTGVEDGVNAYVDEDGAWRAQYVPCLVQAYPFGVSPVSGSPEKFTIAIDIDAEPLASPAGQPLFDAQDEPTERLRQRMDLLKRMKEAEPATKRLVQALRNSGLLIDRHIHINRKDDNPTQVTGLQVVDETKFNSLPDDAFLELRNAGLLPLIYSHLLSMANLRQGVIAGKYPDLAARVAQKPEKGQGAKRSSEQYLDTFFSDEGDFKLDFDA